uniref:Uncharacterized protein n=1 Tax=viral metagenome TaxID=1070528 RepID=A0A6H1ZQA0_9ZZZZ
MEDSRILKDTREIIGVYFNDLEGSCYAVDYGYKITAYPEPREYCHVAFIEVEKDGKIVSRFPATMVQIAY